MKEPVSLDLFSDDVCPTEFSWVYLVRRDFMDVLDLLSDPTFSCFPMRLIEARLAEARLALEALGGLGGVW
ncbi:hypothetical protein [Acidithiobacillus ferriphilus]|uniref:hypothetical protein n=1 Tax=Acidithiobacillus ferriphilus TaxID=1689834 RepID=UPI00232C40E1|nr:hypothetical protein [Acidithiobacillus ferriphilus]WCE92689.1 hypothetical protein PJU76_06885 [Acidithiobacillus ferriphilus]